MLKANIKKNKDSFLKKWNRREAHKEKGIDWMLTDGILRKKVKIILQVLLDWFVSQ